MKIIVLDFTDGKVYIYTKPEDYKDDAETYLSEVQDLDMDNIQYMSVQGNLDITYF